MNATANRAQNGTAAGVIRHAPSVPSWPSTFLPQQWSAPFARRPQEWSAASATAVQSVNTEMATGAVRSTNVPSPTSPLGLLPQQYSRPARMPQLCAPPDATWVQSFAVPIWTGLRRSCVVPSPTNRPEHQSVPSLRIEQLVLLPVA